MEGLSSSQEKKMWRSAMGADSSEIRDLEYIARELPENLQIYKGTVLDLARRISQENQTSLLDLGLQKLNELLAKYQQQEEIIAKKFKEFELEKAQESLHSFTLNSQNVSRAIQSLDEIMNEKLQLIDAKYSRENFIKFSKASRDLKYYLKQIWRMIGPISAHRASELDYSDAQNLHDKFEKLRQTEVDEALSKHKIDTRALLDSLSSDSLGEKEEEWRIILEKQNERKEAIKNLRESFKRDFDLLKTQILGGGEHN